MADSSPISFVNLPAQFADREEELLRGMREIIHKGSFVGGPVLVEFEAKLAAYAGARFARGCSDGTSALKLALLASGIKPQDGVIVPTNSFIASAFGVTHAGGTPILVDCDPRTYLIDLNQVEKILKSGRAQFVMPVHLYGNPCPMVEILAMADQYGAKVIEDNAQAIGAKVAERKTGSLGLAAGISFYPAKNLGAFGQGGAILTNDETIATRVRTYSEQGQGGERYYHEVVGYNDRLHTIQAFILGQMLDKLDGFNAARLRVANWYAQRLPADRLQARTADSTPVYHLFVYRCDSREHRAKVAAALEKNQIGFGYHYPVPIHKQRAYPDFNNLALPVAERLADTLISLPMHPFLTREEVQRVCDTVLQV